MGHALCCLQFVMLFWKCVLHSKMASELCAEMGLYLSRILRSWNAACVTAVVHE